MCRTESIVDEVPTCHKFRNGSVTSSGAEWILILENRMTASFQEWNRRRDNGALLLEMTVHAGSGSEGRRMPANFTTPVEKSCKYASCP